MPKRRERPSIVSTCLYDKVCTATMVAVGRLPALALMNGGAAGIDGQDVSGDIELYGVQKWLGELGGRTQDEGTYRPNPVCGRVYIPKPDGKAEARWGIPND